jgi:serine/threonine-protein kinase HipA
MALMLNGSKKFPSVKELATFARLHCDLALARARKGLQRVAAGVKRAAGEIRDYASQHEDFGKAADRLIARFDHGLQRLDLT